MIIPHPGIGNWQETVVRLQDGFTPAIFHEVRTRSFLPNPLKESAQIEWTDERAKRLAAAGYWLGKTSVKLGELEAEHIGYLSASFIRKEAIYSSRIEGTRTTLADYLAYEDADSQGHAKANRDALEVMCNVEALETMIGAVKQGYPITNHLIKAAHGTLMRFDTAKRYAPGQFREIQNFIGRPGDTPEEQIKFVPPPPMQVEPCMSSICDFVENDTRHDTLIKAALAHALFEIVHPFCDGNGRIGRVLIPSILTRSGHLPLPALPISLILKRRREDYYRHLQSITENNTWGPWVDFFLECVAEAGKESERIVENYKAMLKRDTARFRNEKGNDYKLWRHLLERPVCSVKQIVETTGITAVQTYSIMEKFKEMGMVVELPKVSKKDTRTYAYISMFVALRERLVFNGTPILYGQKDGDATQVAAQTGELED